MGGPLTPVTMLSLRAQAGSVHPILCEDPHGTAQHGGLDQATA